MSEDLFGLESADAMWWMRNVNLHLEIIVRREYLLFDLIVSLADAFSSNPGTFKLPLKVVFTGEEAVDHGGNTCPCFPRIFLYNTFTYDYFRQRQESPKNCLH